MKSLMRFPILVGLFALMALGLSGAIAPAVGAGADTRCFERRIYHVAPGKLDDLHARFRNHTNRLLQKHGITLIGYWTPMEVKEGEDQTLIFILAYPSRAAREKSWKEFMADPDWQAAYKASEANGPLVTKVEQLFLRATDYSPAIKPAVSAEPRVFELRTYIAAPDRLSHLNGRFRDHTVALFTKHGITNVGYWTPEEKEPGADNTLVYILAHKSREAAAASFKSFGADPAWVAARKASEEQAGGSLTLPNGVKSVFMNATDYSPLR
jgi:hypothetical protein